MLARMQSFYTTPEQEEELERIYEQKIQEKQDEINKETIEHKQKNPKYIQKYTARAFVDKEPRTFVVRSTGITLNNKPTPTSISASTEIEPVDTQVKGGKVYYPDKRFQEGIEAFIQKHPEYTITFYLTSKYGPTIDYTGDGLVCFLLATTGEQLFVEDPDAYEIAVL